MNVQGFISVIGFGLLAFSFCSACHRANRYNWTNFTLPTMTFALGVLCMAIAVGISS